MQVSLKKKPVYCNWYKWKIHDIKFLPRGIAKWIMDKQCQWPPVTEAQNRGTKKEQQWLKVSFSLVGNFPIEGVPDREVSGTALYGDYFPHVHSFRYKFLLLCGFTHEKYVIGKEYKLSLCGIAGSHIAAQQSWTASRINAQRDLPYLWLLQTHKSKKGWQRVIEAELNKMHRIKRAKNKIFLESEILEKWDLCNATCLGKDVCVAGCSFHKPHTIVWFCSAAANDF